MNWQLIVLLGGLLSQPVWAQTPLIIEGQTALTLSQGDTMARADRFQQRLEAVLRDLPPTLTATASGAQVLLNGQAVLEVIPDDVTANAAQDAAGLAKLWAEQIQLVLNQPAVQERLRLTQGLPPVVVWQGQRYTLVPEAVPDIGRFTTDGSRAENHVIFWETEGADALSDTISPDTLYLLNANRQFVPYR